MSATSRRLLTPTQLAETLKVSKSTIYYWSSQKPNFPKYSLGKHLRFDLEEVLEYFRKSNEVSQTQQIPLSLEELGKEIGSLKTESDDCVSQKKEKKDGSQ